MAPGDAPDPQQQSFEASLEGLRGALDNMAGSFNDFAYRASNLPPMIFPHRVGGTPPPIGEPAVLDQARTEVQGAIDRGNEIAARASQVVALFPTAREWTDTIQNPVGAILADPRGADNATKDLVLWEGPAATHYREALLAQKNAVAALATLAGRVSLWLNNVAVANVTFIADTATAHINANTALVNATAGALSTANLPSVVASIISTTYELKNRQDTIDNDSAKHLAGALGQANEASTIINDNNGFSGGRWPNPVAG